MAYRNEAVDLRVVNYSDWSLAETGYLLSEETNARHLRDSLREARSGGAVPRALSDRR